MVSPVTDALHEALSAVMDGSATPAEWARVEAAWSRDPELRERWALWQVAGDGLRSTELAALHRPPEALLQGLHAHLPAAALSRSRRRDWLAPLAVAAGFVVVAVGLVTLNPPPSPGQPLAVASMAAAPVQGLAGTSFAQAASGRTLADLDVLRDAGSLADGPARIAAWEATLPAPASSQPAP